MSSTITVPKHVQTAASEGMKAGFRQFEAASQKSGLQPVKALWSEFEALSAKPRFNLYCAMFGPTVDTIQKPSAVTKAKRTFTRSSGRVKNAVAAPIQEDNTVSNVQRIAELEAEIMRLKTPEATERVIAPKDPTAPITYKQAMYLRFQAGLKKAKVEKLTTGEASSLIALHKAA